MDCILVPFSLVYVKNNIGEIIFYTLQLGVRNPCKMNKKEKLILTYDPPCMPSIKATFWYI